MPARESFGTTPKGKKVKEIGHEINYLFEKKWDQKLTKEDYSFWQVCVIATGSEKREIVFRPG